jgi:hypothetical protein
LKRKERFTEKKERNRKAIKGRAQEKCRRNKEEMKCRYLVVVSTGRCAFFFNTFCRESETSSIPALGPQGDDHC